MGPVCTIMVGRLDDWLKVVANRDDIVTEPEYLEWAGVAAMKKAYEIYKQRGYRLRLLSAPGRGRARTRREPQSPYPGTSRWSSPWQAIRR